MTDEEIARLLQTLKEVSEPPSKDFRIEGRHSRKDFELRAVGTGEVFDCFIRRSTEFLENFSVGIHYVSPSERKRICLLRCNGPHGPHIHWDHHNYFHIHRATADNISFGLSPERNAETTTEYGSLEEALWFFCQAVNILPQERSKITPLSHQTSLFDVGK